MKELLSHCCLLSGWADGFVPLACRLRGPLGCAIVVGKRLVPIARCMYGRLLTLACSAVVEALEAEVAALAERVLAAVVGPDAFGVGGSGTRTADMTDDVSTPLVATPITARAVPPAAAALGEDIAAAQRATACVDAFERLAPVEVRSACAPGCSEYRMKRFCATWRRLQQRRTGGHTIFCVSSSLGLLLPIRSTMQRSRPWRLRH